MNDKTIVTKIHSLQRKYNFYNIGCPFIILAGFIIGFFALFNGEYSSITAVPGLILALVCVIGGIIGATRSKKAGIQLKNYVGEYVIKDVIEEQIEIQKYDPNDFINRKAVSASCLMPKYDEITGSDFIKGTYKGHQLSYCDLHLRRKETTRDINGKKDVDWVTVFQGHFVRMPLKEDLEGFVKIKERKNPRKKRSFIDDLFDQAAEAVGLKGDTSIIETENEAFNDQFEVRTNNEELAFYILTPHFMESIIKLDELAQGYTNINFRNGVVYIAINNGRDSFEVKRTIRSESRLEKSRQEMRNDLKIVLSIIDEILEKDRLFS